MVHKNTNHRPSMEQHFSPVGHLLRQESMLAAACLANGLTALRHANLGDKEGLFYTAFFELATGLERILKVNVILDHMARQEMKPPDSKTIEKFGHKLCKLYKENQKICEQHSMQYLAVYSHESLARRLLDFLDAFAHPGGRYSNINKLTGSKCKQTPDPLASWAVIVQHIMDTHATPSQRKHAQKSGATALSIYGYASICLITDLVQQPLTMETSHRRNYELHTASKYAIYALVCLIASLRDVMETLTHQVRQTSSAIHSIPGGIPELKEFFSFAWANKPYVMRKMRWP